MVLKVLRQYVTICGTDGIVETEGSITLGHRFDYKMDKATKSKFRISRSGRLGAAGPQFYDVGTIFNFLKGPSIYDVHKVFWIFLTPLPRPPFVRNLCTGWGGHLFRRFCNMQT